MSLRRIFLLSIPLVLPFALTAQDAPEPEQPPAAPAPAPAAAPQDDMIEGMQYPNANVQAVLLLYETLTNKKVIYDNSVQGNINIVVNSPVSRDEAVKIIETSLLLNGFSIVPSEGNLIKVLGQGRNARSAGIPIYSSEEQIPPGEQIITYLFKLEYADPNELTQTLNQYLSTGQPYTSFLPLPKTQAVLVTETTTVVRNLIGLIRQIDLPPAEVVSEFIQLRRADAAKIVEYLNEIFERKQQQTDAAAAAAAAAAGPAGQRPQRRVVNPAEEAPQPPPGISPELVNAILSEDNIIVGKIRLTADTRTNRIHVVARPQNLPFLRQLISQFDANVDIGKPVTRPLKFVSAGDVLPILEQILKEKGIETERSEGGGSTGGGTTGSTSTTGGGGSFGGGSSRGSGGSSGGAGGFNLSSEELNPQSVDTSPEAVTIGNTRLIADKRANAIIILGNEDVREKVMKVIDQIDVRAPQVMLNTVVGELSLGKNQQFGFDYILRYLDLGQISGAGLIRNSIVPLVNPARLTNPTRFAGDSENAGLATNGGLSGIITVADSLDIVVRALESSNRFRVVSRPLVFTSNNKKATIASGRQIAVPRSTLTSQEGGVPTTSSSIDFIPIELKLEVVPLINADHEVNLEILQKVDSEAGNRQIDNNLIPEIASRYLRTNVSVPNRATVVLGGLIQEDQTRDRGGIPILSNIPLLGALFSNTNKEKTRSELIILIRPVVINSQEDMIIQKHVEEKRLYLPADLEDTLTPPSPPDPEPQKAPWWRRHPKNTSTSGSGFRK